MKQYYYALPLLAALWSGVSAALPTYVIGNMTELKLQDFTPIKQYYKTENGVDLYAIAAYELELTTYGTVGVERMNFDYTGAIQSAWYSSNFAMTVSLYCDNTLLASDSYEGIRYERASYLVKPDIQLPSHPISAGCDTLKIRMDKLGSVARKYATKIQAIDMRLYLTVDF